MCSWFQFPSGDVTKCYTRSVWRRETSCPYLAGRPGGGSGGRGPLREGRTRQHAPSAWSALVLSPQVPSAPLAPTPSVLTGNDGWGRSAFIKPKITGVSGGRGGGGPERTRPLLALRLHLPSLLLPPLLSPLLLLCGCFNDWGKGLSLHLATENSPRPPLTCKEGWGLRTWGRGPLPPHRDSSTWSPAQTSFPFEDQFCSNPEIKGLRTMTSTLLSPWFSFSLL